MLLGYGICYNAPTGASEGYSSLVTCQPVIRLLVMLIRYSFNYFQWCFNCH